MRVRLYWLLYVDIKEMQLVSFTAYFVCMSIMGKKCDCVSQKCVMKCHELENFDTNVSIMFHYVFTIFVILQYFIKFGNILLMLHLIMLKYI